MLLTCYCTCLHWTTLRFCLPTASELNTLLAAVTTMLDTQIGLLP